MDVLRVIVRLVNHAREQLTHPLVGSDLASPRPYGWINNYHRNRRPTLVTLTFIKVRDRGERVEGTCKDDCSIRS